MGDDVVADPSECYINEWLAVPPPMHQLGIIGIMQGLCENGLGKDGVLTMIELASVTTGHWWYGLTHLPSSKLMTWAPTIWLMHHESGWLNLHDFQAVF